MPEFISFLHLSDIHFTKGTSNVSSFDIDRIVRNELERDAINLLPSIQPLSGIIISGDIAFAGKPEEFQTGISWLADLSGKLNCNPGFVWCVPGNHDVDRNVIREHTGISPIQNEIRTSTDLHTCMKKHLTGGDAALLFEPLRGYNDSIGQRFECATVPAKPWWEFDLALNDGSILRLRGLNSAIISGENDAEHTYKLCLGPAQYEYMRDDDVTFLTICHHPPDWLVDGAQVRTALKAYSKIILTGHKHFHEEEEVNGTLWLSSGAVHPSRAEQQWEPTYYYLKISVELLGEQRSLKVDLFRRVWDDSQKAFVRPAGQGEDFKTYRLPLAWRDATRKEVPAVAQPSTGGIDVSLNRKKLLYAFVALPYHTRLSIMEHLKLIDDENRGLPDNERFASCFDRATKQNRLNEVWDMVESRQANS
jgi:predicted phosphodiesterase